MLSKHTFLLLTILHLCYVSTQQHSVIIIGAGAAGLAAATRLLEHNVTDVTVLEAQDRIGGRVNSVMFDDVIVELGAEWVDGETGNVVYDLVKDLKLFSEPEAGWDIILFSDGKALNKELGDEVMGIFSEVSRSLIGTDGVNVTTGDAFPPAYKAAVQKKYANDPETLNLALQCLPLLEKVILARDSSFSWYDSEASRTFRSVAGTQGIRWNNKGFKQIFDAMANKIPNTNGIDSLLGNVIHLKQEVLKINYKDDKTVVTCKYGTQYKADYVLFTPSLGVLKHEYKDVFRPALPENKIKAIEDLGYGAIMKILMRYEDNWWPNDTGAGGYNFVFTDNEEKEIAKLFPNDPAKDGKSWLSSILGVYPWKDSNILVYWVVGPLIPDIEQLSDDRINAGIDYLLKKFFKDQEVTINKPDKIMKTSWYTNPHFRGTYSFETVQADEFAHRDLSEPVKNADGKDVLFFAGEATLSGHYGTVHGAMETGYREANRILKEMEKE